MTLRRRKKKKVLESLKKSMSPRTPGFGVLGGGFFNNAAYKKPAIYERRGGGILSFMEKRGTEKAFATTSALRGEKCSGYLLKGGRMQAIFSMKGEGAEPFRPKAISKEKEAYGSPSIQKGPHALFPLDRKKRERRGERRSFNAEEKMELVVPDFVKEGLGTPFLYKEEERQFLLLGESS